MADFTNIPEAYDAIRAMELSSYSKLPQEVKDVLDQTAQVGTSPVDRVVRVAEAIYAKRDDANIKAEQKEVAAGLFTVAAMHGWHGLNDDLRAQKAAKVLRGAPVPAADIPSVAREFQKPAPAFAQPPK
jgi:hypothetical protein